MKKIYLSIVAAVSLMFVSCTADWLNTDPSTAVPVSIRPRACFFPLFSFLPLWLHYNLNPLCVQY